MKRKHRREVQEITSRDITIMDLTAKLAEAERLQGVKNTPVYERHNEVARYIVSELEAGRLTEQQAGEFSRLLDVPLQRTVGVQVDVRFTLEMHLPYDVAKEDAVHNISFHAFGVDEVRTLGTKILDMENVRI
jgi:hypothetical protein